MYSVKLLLAVVMGGPAACDDIPGNKDSEFTSRSHLAFFLQHCQEDAVLEVQDNRKHISVPDRKSKNDQQLVQPPLSVTSN